MALLILPIGLALGWVLGKVRVAVILTLAIGAGALVVYLIAGTRGVEVSPFETLVLIVCLPVAMWLAKWAAARRGQ